jgi:hypothetical protein
MSEDIACLGICIVDPDTGVCMGCGRGPEEISGVPTPESTARKNPDESPLSASQYPLPPQVANQIGDGD